MAAMADTSSSPFIVDITALKRNPSVPCQVERSIPHPADLGLASAGVRADDLRLDLQLELAGAELIAQGDITVSWSGPCRRCLDDVERTDTIEVHEIFQHRPVEGETYLLGENEVDLEPMVRESVLLQLPVAPLCSDTCPGPDPSRFPTTVESDDEPPAETTGDPRWSALSELTFDE